MISLSIMDIYHHFLDSDAYLISVMYLEDTKDSQDPKVIARRKDVQHYLDVQLSNFLNRE